MRVDELLKAYKTKKTPDLCCELGDFYMAKGDPKRAIPYYESALEIDGRFARALASIGDVCAQYGQGEDAVEYYASAIHCAPDNLNYKLKIVPLLETRVPSGYHQDFINLIIDLLKSDALRHSYGFGLWYRLFDMKPEYESLRAAVTADDYAQFAECLSDNAVLNSLLDPFFLLGLQKIHVTKISFEHFLTFLRRYLILNFDDVAKRLSAAQRMDLYGSLSVYCLATEYIFAVQKDEDDALDIFLQQIGMTGTQDSDRLCRYIALACYRHISLLEWNQDDICKLSAQSGFYDAHIQRYRTQHQLAEKIESLTPVEDNVSKAVQAQYEDFPYPQWDAYWPHIRNQSIEGRFCGVGAHILVAGCGTGREAIEHAICFPDAKITAIDLSKASLSYAMRKANELGIQNISFYQADILRLTDWDRRFDYVSSSGVIHHMQNPEDGLAILTRLLKPNGVLRLGLYSRLARRHIIAAREIIAQSGYTNDTAGIRKFRHDAPTVLPTEIYDCLTTLKDYYSLSECRDLLFHVQEHNLGLLEIKEMLERKNLEFSAFYLEQSVLNEFKAGNKRPNAVKGLDLWAKFEEKHPDTFIGMYAFWCIKRN